MKLLLAVFLIFLKSPALLTKPAMVQRDAHLVYAPSYLHQQHGVILLPEKYQEPIFVQGQPPLRTEVLINNTLVAGGMLYRFFRAIYRAGTIIYSYMPALPLPF